MDEIEIIISPLSLKNYGVNEFKMKVNIRDTVGSMKDTIKQNYQVLKGMMIILNFKKSDESYPEALRNDKMIMEYGIKQGDILYITAYGSLFK